MLLRHLVAVAAVSGSVLTAAPTAPADVPPSPPLTRPCFLEPARWNAALDGPLPKCPAFAQTRMPIERDRR